MYDLIIIGSGPAGLSAAIYGKRAGLHLLVIEKHPMSGGQVLNTYEVDNYLGLPGINGFDMGMKFREHADTMGIEFVEAQVKQILNKEQYKIVQTDEGDFESKTLIIATGAHHAKLGVPGEEEFAGMGVSYCATCDGAFFKNKIVAVVGGGDVAVEDAIFLARTCKKVYLIHRRDELRAADILVKALLDFENVEILWSHVVKEIRGKDTTENILVHNLKTDQDISLSVEGVFIAVGVHPETEIFKEVVELDQGGYIVAGEVCATAAEGIFAAGDCRTKPLRQIITAVADGANAATGAWSYLIEEKS